MKFLGRLFRCLTGAGLSHVILPVPAWLTEGAIYPPGWSTPLLSSDERRPPVAFMMRPRRLLCTTEWHTTPVHLHERSSPRALSITRLLENPPAVPTCQRGRPRVGNNPQHMRHGLSQRDACADAGCDVVAKPDTATPRPSAAAGGRGQSRRSRCAAVPLQLSRQGAEPGRSRANQQQGLAGVAQGPSAPPTAHAWPAQPRGCSPDRPRCDCFPPLQLPGEATAAPPENLWEKESAAQLLVVTRAHTLDFGGHGALGSARPAGPCVSHSGAPCAGAGCRDTGPGRQAAAELQGEPVLFRKQHH